LYNISRNKEIPTISDKNKNNPTQVKMKGKTLVKNEYGYIFTSIETLNNTCQCRRLFETSQIFFYEFSSALC
jgi:hypothetical protein